MKYIKHKINSYSTLFTLCKVVRKYYNTRFLIICTQLNQSFIVMEYGRDPSMSQNIFHGTSFAWINSQHHLQQFKTFRTH